METNNRIIGLYVSSGLLVITSTFVFFILDFLKDGKPNQLIQDNIYFNIGTTLALICLPILAFGSYLLSMINVKRGNVELDSIIDTILTVLRWTWILDTISLLLVLMPFNIKLNGIEIPFGILAIIGICIGVTFFVTYNAKLRNKIIELKKKE